ncbi:MAG: type II secretion system protein [Phycisphaeraceae bacterium]
MGTRSQAVLDCCRWRARRAFTLIELLVLISIVTLLIALLMPAFGRATESARRVQCMSNQSQLIAGATAAAVEDDHVLTDLGSVAGGHITWINDASYDTLGGHFDASASKADKRVVRYHQFFCPNRIQDWKRAGGAKRRAQIRTGYEVLFGRHARSDFKRNDRYRTPGLAWRSTLTLHDPQPGTILRAGPDSETGLDNVGLMLADINEEGTLDPPITSAAHGPRGYVERKAAAGQIDPGRITGEGGNLGFIDGSVVWRRFADMHAHNNHQGRTNVLAWW